MFLAVVIPTRNRAKELLSALEWDTKREHDAGRHMIKLPAV
jgi:hypothetical protein